MPVTCGRYFLQIGPGGPVRSRSVGSRPFRPPPVPATPLPSRSSAEQQPHRRSSSTPPSTGPRRRGAQMTPLVLVGLMGSGKSTVGRLVADRLGWPMVDSDEAIEARTGQSVRELWEEGG